MSPELEKKLIEKYPILFQDKDKSPKETLMCWGICTGDGWYKILDDLFGYFYNIMDNEVYLPFKREYIVEGDEDTYGVFVKSPKIKLVQLKSKFATLRCYTITYDDESISNEVLNKLEDGSYQRFLESINRRYDFAVDYAEYLSSKTCEICGKEGKLVGSGWLETLCEKHTK